MTVPLGKRRNKYDFFRNFVRRKPLFSKRIIRFVKLHLKKPQDFWNNALKTHEIKSTAPCLEKTKRTTSAQTPHTNSGLVLLPWDLSPPRTLKFSRVKCEAICLMDPTWLKLGHATRQKCPVRYKNHWINVLHWATNLNEVTQRCGEKWAKVLLVMLL